VKIILRCIIVGLASAVAFGALSFSLVPLFDAYVAPFRLLAPIMDKVPVTLINGLNRLLPVAGPAAGVGIILATVLVFWTAIFGAIYFAWVTWM
jgi:hypothetical protein